MPDLAYVHNQRKDNLGQWVPLEAYESITVSSDYPYTSTLSERPANGIDIPNTTVPEIPGLTITTNSGAIGPSEYYVNYLAGIITFHSSKAGLSFTVHYYKTGTVVTAEQINTVIARLVHFDRDPLPTDNTYEIGTIWVSTNTVVGIGTVRRIWLCSDVQNDESKWSFQGPSISVENDLHESTSVNVYSDGRVEFVILDELAGCFNCSRDFFIYNLGPIAGLVKNDSAGKLIGGQSISFADMGITVNEPLAIIDDHLLHRLTPGNKHIPEGGSSGQILSWSSDGTADWATISANYTAQSPISITDDTISHDSTSGYMHIPEGGSSGQALIWASDGTAAWVTLPAGSIYAATAPITLIGNTFGHAVSSGYMHIPSGGTTNNFLSWTSNGVAVWKSINLDGTFALNLDSEIPSQKAIKTYVDTTISDMDDWVKGNIPAMGPILFPKDSTNGILSQRNIFLQSAYYTGPNSYAGLFIIHTGAGSNDGLISFNVNGATSLIFDNTGASFTHEVMIDGNLSSIKGVVYNWPSVPATNFSILSNDGTAGNLTWKTISTDGSMATNSDFVISSQRAIKTYVDNAVVGLNYWGRVGYVLSPANINDWLNNPYKLQASFMTTAGLVRNDSSGYLSGGNTVATSDLTTGFVLPVSKGGTGLSTVSAGKMLYGLDSSTYSSITLSGVTDRIILDTTTTPGTILIKTPQDIATSSPVHFGSVTANYTASSPLMSYFAVDSTTVSGWRVDVLNVASDLTGVCHEIRGISFKNFYPLGKPTQPEDTLAMGIEIGNLATNAGNTPGAYQSVACGIKIGNIGNRYLTGQAIGIEIGNIGSNSSGYHNMDVSNRVATVGLRIGTVSGGYNPLSIHTKGGNILHEGCNLFSIGGYSNITHTPDWGSAYINLDYTCVDDMSSVAGIRWRMNGISKFELRTQYVNYTPGAYDPSIHDAGNLHFYACDDSGGFFPQSFPLMSLYRKEREIRIDGYTKTNSFSTVGYYGNVHDVLEPPFPLGHIYYGYTEHPGSFISGTIPYMTINLWTVSAPPSANFTRAAITSGTPGENWPIDHPKAFYPRFELADHYGHGCCSVNHGMVPSGTDCGQYITLPFTFQPGWKYEIRLRVKQTPGTPHGVNLIKVGDAVGNWYDVWYAPEQTDGSIDNWINLCISPCITGTMLNCNRLFLGDRNELPGVYYSDYKMTWVEVKQFSPTNISAVGSACHISQEMIAADKIQFGGLRLDPSQVVPTGTDGNVGDIRVVRDNGLGECRLYTKILPTVWKSALLSL